MEARLVTSELSSLAPQLSPGSLATPGRSCQSGLLWPAAVNLALRPHPYPGAHPRPLQLCCSQQNLDVVGAAVRWGPGMTRTVWAVRGALGPPARF